MKALSGGASVALSARRMRYALFVLVLAVPVGSCGASPVTPDPIETCDGFGEWQASPYVLPYAIGASYFVDQGNCSPPGNGHRGVAKFGYDFLMPIGTPVYAARGGLVIEVEESHFDGQVAATGFDNVIVIQHDDGTTTLYGHLTHDGAVVNVGERVLQGALVGYSGNTGNTNNKPHLHLSAASCDQVALGTANCPTLPMNFRNTEPNTQGPQQGHSYTALPY